MPVWKGDGAGRGGVPGAGGRVDGGLWMAAGFLATARPWLILQGALRPLLAQNNAHCTLGYRVSPVGWGLMAAGLAVLEWARRTGGPRQRRRAEIFLVWSVVLCVAATPVLNRRLAALTSDYMANRVFSLAPLPVIVGMGWERALAFRRMETVYPVVFAVVMAALLAGPPRRLALVHLYLARTHDLDRHWCGHLRRLAGIAPRGVTALSDPMTSYFCRGMLGWYVMSVPAGDGSPAHDYADTDRRVKALLSGRARPGRHEGFQVVVIEKRNRLTEHFTGYSARALVVRWRRRGWRVAYADGDVTVLRPPTDAAAETKRDKKKEDGDDGG